MSFPAIQRQLSLKPQRISKVKEQLRNGNSNITTSAPGDWRELSRHGRWQGKQELPREGVTTALPGAVSYDSLGGCGAFVSLRHLVCPQEHQSAAALISHAG